MSLAARRRRWSRAAHLALLVIALSAGAVWLHDRGEMSTAALVLPDTQRLVISRPGRSDIALERDGPEQAWRIHTPCALEVEPRRLSPLFEALAGGGPRYPRADVEPVGAGLADPIATLTFDDDTLSVGSTDLSGERRYVADARHVELVPEWIWPLINGGLSALATGDVFTRSIRTIKAVDQTLETDVAVWNALQAVQIIDWPPAGQGDADDAVEPARTSEPGTGQRVTLTFEDGSRATRTLVSNARYDALVHEHGGCAHLLAPGTLSASATTAPRDID